MRREVRKKQRELNQLRKKWWSNRQGEPKAGSRPQPRAAGGDESRGPPADIASAARAMAGSISMAAAAAKQDTPGSHFQGLVNRMKPGD